LSDIIDDDDGDETSLFITFTFNVKLIRIISSVMVPSEFKIIASIDRATDATDTEVEVALTKWRYWFEHVVSKSVSFSTDNDHALAMLLDEDGMKRVGNILMLTPEDPSDEVLGALFQAKMNALGVGKVICAAVDISSDNMHGLSFTLAGDHSTFLPSTTEEWLGSASVFENPWWTRNDASSVDVLATDDMDSTTPPTWAYSLDFLDRATQAQNKTKVAGRPQFNPTVIDGGIPDDE
jgi:hypothetical protein